MKLISENPNFENRMTMRVPVAGTVPRGFIPFDYTIDAESRIRAGKELVNPFLPGAELFTGAGRSIPHFVSDAMEAGEKETVICIQRTLSGKTSFTDVRNVLSS